MLSKDEASRKIVYKKVTELFYHEVDTLFEIRLSNGEIIETTWNHPFQYQNNQIGDDKKALPVYNLTSDGKIEKVNDLEELLLVGIPAYQKIIKNGKEAYIQIKGKDIETNINKLRREDGLSIKRRKYKNVD